MQALSGLKRWQSALKEEAGFAVEAFSCFLPKRQNIDLGKAWTFVVPDMSRYGQFIDYLIGYLLKLGGG